MFKSKPDHQFFTLCHLEIGWMTLKNNRAPDLCYFKLHASFRLETLNLGQNWWFFILCDLEIWQMTLQNNRAHRLCYFKLCASSQNHLWIQTGFTVQKHSICMNFFLSSVTLKFEGWPWIWHLFYTTSSFVHNFEAICEFKNEVSVQEKPKFGQNLFWALWPWPFTSDLDFLYGHHFCQW